MTLDPNSKYQLDLHCAPQDGTAYSSNGFRVLWNDVVVLDGSTVSDYNRRKYRVTVLTDSGTSYKITIQGTGTIDDIGSACDNVKLNKILTEYNKVIVDEVNETCACMPGYY